MHRYDVLVEKKSMLLFSQELRGSELFPLLSSAHGLPETSIKSIEETVHDGK